MSVPALYIATPEATPVPCTVRVMAKVAAHGQLRGSRQLIGSVQMDEDTPRLFFLKDDKPPFLRNSSIVSVEVGEAYRIDHVEPAQDIVVPVAVTVLSAADTAGLPVPSDG